MNPVRTITPITARRLAISKQWLAGPRPPADRAGIMEVLSDLGYVQLDPISVVSRSHQLVLWSRLGTYDLTELNALLWEERRLFEYWAQAASIVLTEDYPIHDLLMRSYPKPRPGEPAHRVRTRAWIQTNRALARNIMARLRVEGPLPLRAFEDRAVQGWTSTGWTSGRNVERMLDVLWTQGKVMVAGRSGIQKLWDLAERWLPEWTPRDRLPKREIVRLSAQRSLRALGVGTIRDIGRHFVPGRYPDLPLVLAELERRGIIDEIAVADAEGRWPGRWLVHAEDIPLLDRLEKDEWEPRTTLLSPFDNLIIDRERLERLFGFHYRMEIYVPKEKRRFGYYAMPLLHGERLIGRADPALDRKRGVLRLNSVHREPGAQADRATKRAVAGAIEDLAGFLGATDIEYARSGF